MLTKRTPFCWKTVFSILFLLAINLTVPAASLVYYSVTEGSYNHQDPGGSPVLRPYAPWFFDGRMVFTNASGTFILANLTGPGNNPPPISLFAPNYEHVARETNQTSLQTQFSTGAYTFSFFINSPPYKTATVTLTTGTIPAAPNVTNLSDAQTIDPSSDFTLAWNAFSGGTTNDLIICSLQNGSGTVFQTPIIPQTAWALDGTATSVVIPAGTLAPGRSYLGYLVFAKVQFLTNNESLGATGAALYASQTDFYVKTQGAGDTSVPAVLASVPAASATNIATNAPIIIAFNKPMSPGYSLTWSGAGTTQSVWNSIGTMLAIAPVSYFPANTLQTVVLNPLPTVEFNDTNLNLLPPDTQLTFTTGANHYQPATPALTNASTASPTGFQADLEMETNRGYVLQWSSNLTIWAGLATNMAFEQVNPFTDTNTTPHRFYRAIPY